MSLITANGIRVLSAEIVLPRVGVWSAILTLDGEAALSGAVTISADGVTFQGTARPERSSVVVARSSAFVVGGAGGLPKTLGPKSYTDVASRLPILDILAEAGETLSATSTASVLATPLPWWVRTSGSASTALEALASASGGLWRVLRDGSVFVGVDAGAAAVVTDLQTLTPSTLRRRDEIAGGTLEIAPGSVLAGKAISTVVHRIKSAKVRTEVFYV